MTYGFLFPGQGSQYVGMGKDLYEEFPIARQIFDRAEELLQFPLKEICFEGPEDRLKQTRYTQPAIYVHSYVVYRLLEERGIHPSAAAGHSLGEYSAFVSAGAIEFEDGLRLVKIRGELMQKSGEVHTGTMAAIIGLEKDAVEAVCQEASQTGLVQPANFNSPGQIVVSGTIPGVQKAMEIAKARGARIVKQLPVSGAFHSPLMKEALEGLEEALSGTQLMDANIPVYCNVTAQPVKNADEIRDLLQRQILSPVLWEDIIRNMIQDGYTDFLEVGPGKVLTGLLKRIDRSVVGVPLDSRENLIKLIERKE